MEDHTLTCVLTNIMRSLQPVRKKQHKREVCYKQTIYIGTSKYCTVIYNNYGMFFLFLLFLAKADFFASVASRPRHSPYPLLPVDQALQTVLKHTPTLPAVEVTNLIGIYYIASQPLDISHIIYTVYG